MFIILYNNLKLIKNILSIYIVKYRIDLTFNEILFFIFRNTNRVKNSEYLNDYNY